MPLIAVHISYFLAASSGHVPWCNPYWDSCTSISAAGRLAPEFYWFKLTMIPAAILMMIYWQQVKVWQLSQGETRSWPGNLGTIGAIFLIVYVVALGVEGDLFRLQRRIGIILYFALTYLSQLLLVIWLLRKKYRNLATRLMFTITCLLLVIGLSSIAIDLMTDWHDEVEDAYEWVMALLIHIFYIVSYWSPQLKQP